MDAGYYLCGYLLGGLYLAVLVGAFLNAFRSFWKPARRKPKPRTPINARSGRLRRKAVWARYQPPDAKAIAFMERCRADNIARARSSQPMMHTKAALRQLGLLFEEERPTWYDGDCFVLSDLWCPRIRTTIELDGSQHSREALRDAEKAQIILQATGFRTVRLWNWEAMKPDIVQRIARKLYGSG